MIARPTLTIVSVCLAVSGCHVIHGLEGQPDAGSSPISLGPDAAPLALDDGPPDAGVCQGLPSPTFRIVQVGTAPCADDFGSAMHDLRVTAAPDLDGVRLDYNTSFTLEADHRCRIELMGVGTDVADGQPESWRSIEIPILRLTDSGLSITRLALTNGTRCRGDFILWVGEVALPAQGPQTPGRCADWVHITDAGRACSGPVTRCSQHLHEIRVRAEGTGAEPFGIRPGETRSLALGHDSNRLHVRLFDTPRTCGPADGGGELFASLVAWRTFPN